MTVGERIRKAREEKGWTKTKLAKLSGLARSSIRDYEADKSDPQLFSACCIADALGISLDWLSGRKDE